MLSYWEADSLVKTEVAIIGGGVIGLSVAASIKEKWPNKSVMVFERSVMPYGASTRNAGFACFGSLTEVVADMALMGEEAARMLLFQRWMGLKINRKRLGDQAIGFLELGGYELLSSDDRDLRLSQLAEVNALIDDFLPDYVSLTADVKSRLGLVSDGDLYEFRSEGQVHTGQLMLALEQYVLKLGVRIRTGAEVVEFNSKSLRVKDTFRGDVEFSANEVVVCTNAFASEVYPELAIEPGRGQVFITEPIIKLKFQGNLHLDEGYYYLRSVGDRLLFGGARNLDFAAERTAEMALNNEIQSNLEETLRWLFGEDFGYTIDQRWTGIMAFGESKLPIIKRREDDVLIALKMGGMGIALSGFVGEEIVSIMAEG